MLNPLERAIYPDGANISDAEAQQINPPPPDRAPLVKDEELLQRTRDAKKISREASRDSTDLIEAANNLESNRSSLRSSGKYTETKKINSEFKNLYKNRQSKSRKNIKRGVEKYTYPITEIPPIEDNQTETPPPPTIIDLPLKNQ